MKDRVGTDRDADSLTKLFTQLGFYTNRYDNLKGKEMRSRLQVKLNTWKYLQSFLVITEYGTIGSLKL